MTRMYNFYYLTGALLSAGAVWELWYRRDLPVVDVVLIVLSIMLVTVVVVWLMGIRNARISWGNVLKPVLIADHASFGRYAKNRIPEHLRDNVIIFVPARKVRQTEQMVIRKLTDAENRYYLWPESEANRLPVKVRFFRDPKFGNVNESADDYLTELFRLLEIENQTYLSMIREQSSDAEYEQLMFTGHRNGSAWNE